MLVALICLKQFYSIFNDSKTDIRNFLTVKGNYYALRTPYPTLASAIKAKKIIPPDASVSISRSASGIENIAAQYSLYPLKLSENSDYLIDLANSVKTPSRFSNKKHFHKNH